MKDCITFLKLQEAALNKQTEARRQGYEGSNKPPTNQQGNNGAPQGQDQQNQGHDDDKGYIPSKGHIAARYNMCLSRTKKKRVLLNKSTWQSSHLQPQ
jgi:hypothetical protein